MSCDGQGMTCLKRFAKGAALFEQSTRSGSMATTPSLNWPVYVFSDVPSAADQALGFITPLFFLLPLILALNLTSALRCCLKDPLAEADLMDED